MNTDPNAVYLELTNLSSIPDPLASVSDAILAIAFVLVVAGFLLSVARNKDSPEPGMEPLLRCAIVTACIAMLPMLRELLLGIFYYIPFHLISQGHGINEAGDKIREHIATAWATTKPENVSMFSINAAVISSMITGGFCQLLSFIASLILIPFYIIQRLGELIGFAFMPIALALITIPSLADKGTLFVLSVLSILAWPTGFVLASVTANAALELATMTPLPGVFGVLGAFIAPIVAGCILITGTVSTPLLAYFLFSTGGSYLPTPTSAAGMAGPARMLGSAVMRAGRTGTPGRPF